MKWLFKVGSRLYTRELNIYNLKDMDYLLSSMNRNKRFIELENTLINVNLIEQVCEEELYINGTIKI